MVSLSHDWDDENYVATLEGAYEEYRKACYGLVPLAPTQEREVRQAFLSGVHWLNGRTDWCPDDLQNALRHLLY